ncbi:NnrS family protein [Kistimonas asteriae]|uniref:NnrS family protein n=1 Tax=Kistimonas asteriae TaxID=517724 RepID=UPI001BA98ABF|nr:NnrS family protein [Kistimonas asteriae]
MHQIIDRQQAARLHPLLRLGFRPFFLAGALFSIACLVPWGFYLLNGTDLSPYGGMLWWHMHEMVFGFSSAIIAGFLLTAVQTWTGIPGLKGMPLAALVLLWLAGRLLLVTPGNVPPLMIALVDCAFPLVTAFIMARYVIRVKMWRNLVFTPVLLLMSLASARMYYGQMSGDYSHVTGGAYSGVYLITLLMVVLGGRVIPFFTAKGTGTLQAEKRQWVEACAIIPLIIMALLVVSGLSGWLPWLVALCAAIALTANLIRFLSWRSLLTLGTPLLWSLHGAYAFILLGLLLTVMHYAGLPVPATSMIHALTLGGIGGLILAMMARVSLGHTGRPLVTGKAMALAFFLILMSAIIRLSAGLLTTGTVHAWLSSIALWVSAYGIFFIVYLPMLSKPRVDGAPG